jgi:hypothetical protein
MMNAKLMGLTLAAVAPLMCMYPAIVWASDAEVSSAVGTADGFVTISGDDTGAVAVVGGDSGDGGPKWVTVTAGDDTGPGSVKVSHGGPMTILTSGADADRGWLGVMLGEVPPSLAAHLPQAEDGLMIVNVVEGSPAEQAGLQEHDIIVALDGESVTGGVGDLAKAIGDAGPGTKIILDVLRGGTRLSITPELGSRPAERFQWIHKSSPDADTLERQIFKLRGKMLSKDEEGNWQLEDLGDLSEFDSLPEQIREALPHGEKYVTRIHMDSDDEHATVMTVVLRDGEIVCIRQEDEGEISVTRTDAEGNTTEATYADAEALKAADEEAYDIYANTTQGSLVDIEIEDGDDDIKLITSHGPHAFLQAREEWKEQIADAMKEAHKAMEEAQRSYTEAHKRVQGHLHGMQGFPFHFGDEDFTIGFVGQAKRSFRVDPDGQIEVIIRKGGTEVTRVFRNEEDLQAREPDLYDAYVETLEADGD